MLVRGRDLVHQKKIGRCVCRHTPTDFVSLTYINTNNYSVLCHIYIASLINSIQPDDDHSSIARNI